MPEATARSTRADARDNYDALLAAARVVLGRSGVEAPVREIAAEAGVGVATLYRHFPHRSDIVAAVLRTEVDEVAAAATTLSQAVGPVEALEQWVARFTRFVATKKGLAAALRSGDPGLEALPGYFREHIGPAMSTLLADAVRSGDVRADVDAEDLLMAIADLSHRAPSPDGSPNAMVRLLLDGLLIRT